MQPNIRVTHKAARLAALYELRDRLPGLTQQQISDAFGMKHRSAACRDLVDLERVSELVPIMRRRLDALIKDMDDAK